MSRPSLATMLLASIAQGQAPALDKIPANARGTLFQQKSNQLLFSLMQEHVDRYGEPPTIDQLRVSVKHSSDDTETTNNAEEALSAIFETPKQHAGWIKDQWERLVQQSVSGKNVEKAFTEGSDSLTRYLEAAVQGSKFSFEDEASQPASFVKDDAAIVFERKKRIGFQSVPSLPSVVRKEVYVLMGQSNSGKSAWLVNLGCDLLRQGLKVLYISLENDEAMTIARIIANLTATDLSDLDVIGHQQVTAMLPDCANNFAVRYLKSGSHTGDFQRVLKDLHIKRSFVPDVLLLDYIGEAGSRSDVGRNSTMYETVGSAMSDFKSFVVDHDLIGITAAQVTREAYGGRISLKNTANSMKIVDAADVIVSFCVSETIPNTVEVSPLKMRAGQFDPKPFLVSRHLPIMTFAPYDGDVVAVNQAKGLAPKLVPNRKSTVPKALRSKEAA